jgi:thiol-disulfide isomerase/thioredoxin
MSARQIGLAAALAALALAGLTVAWAGGGTMRPWSGGATPPLALRDLAGKEHKLADYKGKVVVLNFWATWCDPCREEIPHFVELQQKYGDRGLQIIGVSMDDSPEPVRPFYQRFHMNYPVVMGTAKTGELYGGILGLPISFLIGRDGRIYSKHIGATEASVFEREITHLIEIP